MGKSDVKARSTLALGIAVLMIFLIVDGAYQALTNDAPRTVYDDRTVSAILFAQQTANR